MLVMVRRVGKVVASSIIVRCLGDLGHERETPAPYLAYGPLWRTFHI
jgi:hypothetical protein